MLFCFCNTKVHVQLFRRSLSTHKQLLHLTLYLQVKVVYIRNLSTETTEVKIKEDFGQYGEVEKAKKMKDYCFVHFKDREAAVKVNNCCCHLQRIVELCQIKCYAIIEIVFWEGFFFLGWSRINCRTETCKIALLSQDLVTRMVSTFRFHCVVKCWMWSYFSTISISDFHHRLDIDLELLPLGDRGDERKGVWRNDHRSISCQTTHGKQEEEGEDHEAARRRVSVKKKNICDANSLDSPCWWNTLRR